MSLIWNPPPRRSKRMSFGSPVRARCARRPIAGRNKTPTLPWWTTPRSFACPAGLPVNDVLRYSMYYEGYGSERVAMEKYAALGAGRQAEGDAAILLRASRCL